VINSADVADATTPDAMPAYPDPANPPYLLKYL
jgi:hypothetical protein